MPYRLRCKFPGGSVQAPRTLLAERGAFALIGRVSNGISYIPPTADDSWQKLSTSEVSGQSPSLNNGWWKSLALPTGEHFIANQQTWFFNPNTGAWRKTNLDTTDWHKNVGFRENYDLCYDADRDVIWLGSGGPVGWGGTPGSPVFGDMQYDIANDIWRNIYPASGSTYSPTGADAGYWITANKGYGPNGFDSKYEYFNGHLYRFGSFSIGSAQNMARFDPSQAGVNTYTTLTTINPPWNTTPARNVHLRSGLDYTGKRFWTIADGMELYTYDLVPSAVTRQWVNRPTTGTKPAVPSPAFPDTGSETSTEYGTVAELDEDANALVVWCGTNGNVAGSGGSSQRKTWVLDWSTLAWRSGPTAATATVPPAAVAVMNSLSYNENRKKVQLATHIAPATQIWEFTVGQSRPGKITSMALPSFSGSVYGVNYNKFPYLDNSNSKHTNMCYCPLDGRLYVTGGDTGGASAQDGTWSMSLEDGSWRLDVGKPVYPALPAPSAIQDNGGFHWSDTRAQFIFHGGSFGYGGNVFEYGDGLWFYEPVSKVWTQDKSLFAGVQWTTAAQIDFYNSNTTGCTHGGLYDSVTDIVYAPTTPGAMRRYSMASMTRLSDATWVGYPGSPHVGYSGVYSFEPKPVQLGRWMYFICYGSNGINNKYWLAKWNIDNSAYVELALPDMPAFTPSSLAKEQRLGVSNGKIVWPKTSGADGEISALWIYDPDADTWETDTQVPGYGNFICNAVASLPDGRIVMSGGVFGRQMTHMWFYEVF